MSNCLLSGTSALLFVCPAVARPTSFTYDMWYVIWCDTQLDPPQQLADGVTQTYWLMWRRQRKVFHWFIRVSFPCVVVSRPIHYTDWDWVRTNLGIPVGILDRRGVCCVMFLVGTNAHSCIAWLSQSLSVPTGNSATSLKINTRVFCAYWFLRLSSCVEIKGGCKAVFTRISCLAILSDCSSLCTYQDYFTPVLHLLVQMTDRRCLQAVHLGFQSGIPDDVSLLSYLFLQEYVIPSMYRQNRQQVATGRQLAVLMPQVFCVALDQFFHALVDRRLAGNCDD